MDALVIKEDESTPRIVFDKDKNFFEVSGNSLPEDVLSFYTPVLKWIEEYKKQPNPKTKLVIKANYFNSASSKIFLDILIKFEAILVLGYEVEVEWHYLDMDEDMLMTGREFQELVKIPFTFFPYQG
jgi:hypothetical protein